MEGHGGVRFRTTLPTLQQLSCVCGLGLGRGGGADCYSRRDETPPEDGSPHGADDGTDCGGAGGGSVGSGTDADAWAATSSLYSGVGGEASLWGKATCVEDPVRASPRDPHMVAMADKLECLLASVEVGGRGSVRRDMGSPCVCVCLCVCVCVWKR